MKDSIRYVLDVVHKLDGTANKKISLLDYYLNKIQGQKDLKEMERIRSEAREASIKAIIHHLFHFIKERKENSDAHYEDWIQAIHPENFDECQNKVDQRFYVAGCEYLMIWNKWMQRRNKNNLIVQARGEEYFRSCVNSQKQ